MKDAAATERARRQKAKEWVEAQKNECEAKSWLDGYFGWDKPPAGPPATPCCQRRIPYGVDLQQPTPVGGGRVGQLGPPGWSAVLRHEQRRSQRCLGIYFSRRF